MKNSKKYYQEILKWGSESEEHRIKAIQGACFIIQTLANPKNKKLTDADLEKLTGGSNNNWNLC